jgi:hypothetical protein
MNASQGFEDREPSSGIWSIGQIGGYCARLPRRRCNTVSMPIQDSIGRYTIVIPDRRLWWAADEMTAKLAPERLRKLDVRAGEHLAAILTTAFLACAPVQVDTAGGVDLWFVLPGTHDRGEAELLPARATNAAFEVKSMPGGFRKFDSGIDRDQDQGVDATGRSFDVLVRSVNDVLRATRLWVLRARNQLLRKTGADTSKNVFLVIHPFDYMIAECVKHPVIGPLLDSLDDIEDLDTVWVLWSPSHLTVWSNERREWINLLFNVATVEETGAPQRESRQLDILQEAEQYFLARIGHTSGSPYLFGLSSA